MGKDPVDGRTGLLLLINRLRQNNQPLGRKTLLHYAELKLPFVAQSYTVLVQNLLDSRLAQGDAESFELTSKGVERMQVVAAMHSLHAWFYNEYYQAAQSSPAHAQFCERAYGLNLCQHGLADLEQIQLLIETLQITERMKILDFGCGDGRISEYISDQTGARVWGVDIADRAIELAVRRTRPKRNRLHYAWVDLERGEGTFPVETFDRVCAIDSLFFLKDQKAALQVFIQHLSPGGKMGIFYLCPLDADAHTTALAKACQELQVPDLYHDLAAQNTAHVLKKRQALQDLAASFEAEDSLFLFKNRLADSQGDEHNHRYLYILSPF